MLLRIALLLLGAEMGKENLHSVFWRGKQSNDALFFGLSRINHEFPHSSFPAFFTSY